MQDENGKRVGCFDRKDKGKRVTSPQAQSVMHNVEKFKWRHPRIWRALQRSKEKGVRGERVLTVKKMSPALKKAVGFKEFGSVW